MNGTPSDWTCIAAADGALDRPAEHVLAGARPSRSGVNRAGPQPADEAHPLHVGDEVDGLGDRRELVGPDGQEQEDRSVGVAPDDVAEHPQRVVVGPLDVVDEQGERADVGQLRATATPARSNARRSLASGDRFSKPGSSRPDIASTTRRTAASAGVPAAVSRIAASREQAACDEERAADLLVRGDRDDREAGLRRQVARLEEQAGLADARLALERHRGQARRRALDLLPNAASSVLRPMIEPLARRTWTDSEHCAWTSGSSDVARRQLECRGSPPGRLADHRRDYGPDGGELDAGKRGRHAHQPFVCPIPAATIPSPAVMPVGGIRRADSEHARDPTGLRTGVALVSRKRASPTSDVGLRRIRAYERSRLRLAH